MVVLLFAQGTPSIKKSTCHIQETRRLKTNRACDRGGGGKTRAKRGLMKNLMKKLGLIDSAASALSIVRLNFFHANCWRTGHYTAVYSQTLTAISIFKSVNVLRYV